MSPPTEGPPLHLTVLPQRGGLAAVLTDLGPLARLETIDTAEAILLDLQVQSGRWLDTEAPSTADASSDLRAFGRQLLDRLIPPGIATFLREAAPGALTLQLDRSLAWVPWELAWDGQDFLGEKFRLARRIVAGMEAARAAPPAPTRGTLKVLLVAGGGAAAATASRLNAGLRSMAGVAVSVVSSNDLPRDDLLRLIGANDIVHFAGPVDGRPAPDDSVLWWWEGEPLDIGSIGRLASPPPLLLSQNTVPGTDSAQPPNRAVALDACRHGLNLLSCEPAGAGQAADFLLPLYAALARGAPLAEALRSSRGAFRRTAGPTALAALRAELYGDGAVVLCDRRASVEDNLRQVTILSIDLAGSTRLLGELGAETYSDLLSRYHQACVDIVRRHGGTPDDFQGDDGAMCYFGTPVAREDAAAQALQAALELVDAMQALGLGVRIGVCTGQVVVRDGQPVGSAIHLAARLQALAAPATVVVGESTRRIVRDRFRFEALDDAIGLKGFDGPQACHRLLGAAPAAATPLPAAAGQPSITPFVGRRDELQTLQAHWAVVKAGSLRIVRILGEAGIGKSRLLREFKQALADDGQVFECRCAPEHANSAFQPLIGSLRHQLRLGGNELPEAGLARLRTVVSRVDTAGEGALALLADLLALPLPTPHPILEQPAQRRRELTLDLLVGLARQRAQHAPACLIVEDTHWLDPSSAEFLDRLAAVTRALPLLIVVTARPDAELRWRPRFPAYETELQGLAPELARAMVRGASGGRRLPGEVVQLIAERADGVPLFIEESTRMALETEASGDVPPTGARAVPATVLDLLTARLDRLGASKQVAQVGGTIGREFPLALLEAVLQHPGSPIAVAAPAAALAELVRAGMLLARRDGDGPRYAFRHALMRDAAYGSLLERDRLRLHQVIAGVIRERFADLAERQPELLADHYTEAGLDAEALRFWEAAVRRAASRSAHAEAIAHADRALAVLARMPAGEDRARLELRLQLLLAARLIATRGYGSERVERAYARAMELARLLGDESAAMRVLLGLEGFHFMRADFAKARSYVLDAAARAGSGSGGPIQRVQSRWALANIRMHQGQMLEAVQEMDACHADYLRLEHRPEAVQDPGVMCLCYSAWSLWQLGRPDEARRRVLAVSAHAQEIGHRFSIGVADGFRAAVLHFRGENRAALDAAERAIRVCEENGFAVWLAHARVMRGRIAADLGDVAAGVEEMRQGFEAWSDSGAVVTTPFYLTMRAEGHALDQRPEAGLALLEQALAIVERTGERYYEAEIRRLTGRLTLQSALRAGLDRAGEAERWLLQAQACAQARRLASLALRAALDLADLREGQGRPEEALAILAPARQAVEGGIGTRDVDWAMARLAALRAPA
ncbi:MULTISPECIES: AAA family ATPase [Ramlibacter]|uniref:AAA family ATPase n=1 Tax=Ramlibacter pinisoli TaxID=2682844 RepID=A0A6N8INE8_9BURK|nr:MULTISPECIES: AAA family ATPase [Ramlibacter]MBA2963115.1 AAA family ATPase [Ramlibacter sp. CGMCC 1.13660]MVQ28085.1 AAA family ATPase [Ramlibacter pinisoli]